MERQFLSAGNTRNLNRLYALVLNAEPSNLICKNNLAATSLLLKANLTRAHELAAEVYVAAGTNAILATTYAYSRFLQGKPAEGLGVFARMQPAELEQPPVALYQAVLLWSTGKTNEAVHALDIASRARDTFLPEEKLLLKSCGR